MLRLTNLSDLKDNEFWVSVLGAGTVEEADEPYIISNYPNSSEWSMALITMFGHQNWLSHTFIIRGATSETQIKFMGGQGKNRIFLNDNILVRIVSD